MLTYKLEQQVNPSECLVMKYEGFARAMSLRKPPPDAKQIIAIEDEGEIVLWWAGDNLDQSIAELTRYYRDTGAEWLFYTGKLEFTVLNLGGSTEVQPQRLEPWSPF